MSFDAWVVGFGLSRTLIGLELIASPTAYGVWLLVVLIDMWLLYLYFRDRISWGILSGRYFTPGRNYE